MVRRPPYGAALAVLASAMLSACGTPSAARSRNVVIITLDTTRADFLGVYAAGRQATPVLDRFAASSAVFDDAVTVAPLTLPSHCSLFTGLLPPQHGVRDNADSPLRPRHPTLAGMLRDRGFETGAFVASTVLAADRGLARGFTTYRETSAQAGPPARRSRCADAVIDEALGWLETHRRAPYFLWVHLYDPHAPYDAPEPFAARFAGEPYAAEIAFMDAQLGRLLERIDPSRTIIVIAADHGESLGSHGEAEHGFALYQPALHVPLIVRAPALAPQRVAGVVRLVDVMPTVLELLGVSSVPEIDGVSLLPLLHGERMELEAYAESLYPLRSGQPPVRSLRSGRYKLIASGEQELYDLREDPYERRNLRDERRVLLQAMTRRLATFDRTTGSGASPVLRPIAPDLRERLAALGYVAPAPKSPIDHRIPSPAFPQSIANRQFRNSPSPPAGMPSARPSRRSE